MNSLNKVCRKATIIAVSLIVLSGCGGGSPNGGVIPDTANAVSNIQTTNKVPDIPAEVSAVGGTNKVTLSWKAVSGATSYNIYWSTATGVTATTGTRIASVSAININRGLLPAATYYYVVTAKNNSGESSASGQVSAATAVLDGAVPYTTYCASCHGRLATSSVTDVSETEIRTAMQNVNSMNALTLTDSQIAAISAALMYSN
jgi:mono/diheme cytochrome c family protein